VPFGFIAGVALIEVIAGVALTSGFYIWTAPAWFAWYLLATYRVGVGGVSDPPHKVEEIRADAERPQLLDAGRLSGPLEPEASEV
jgi:hypothetical protein